MKGLIQIFWDVDFRCQHDGLHKIMRDHKLDPKELRQGDFVCFINTRQDRIRVLAGTKDPSAGVLSYYVSPRGRIEKKTLQYIPQAFGMQGFSYSKALARVLDKNLLKGAEIGG